MEQKEQMISMNKMGTEKVSKIMLSMGVPMILSMVLQACYNIVDSMFVARIPDSEGMIHAGESAVNALTLAFPVQMLIVAFGVGTGVGVNAILSRALGENRKEKVAYIAGNGVTLGIIIYIVFLIFGLFGIDLYLRTQTTDTVILGMGNTYLKICTFACVGMVMFAIYEKILQATGKSIYSTAAMIAGAVINIVLDPILIFGYFGLPEMGIAGAAYATVIGQIASFLLAMYFHYGKNKEVMHGLRYLKLKRNIVKGIYVIGFPAIIMQALMSFMTYGVNIIFGAVSTAAVTAYGIFYKIQQFIFFAGFGLRDAITPIVSFNYGMGSKKRVKEGIRYGIIYVEIIMAVGIILLQVFAAPLVAVFGLSDETARLCIMAIRIISFGFLFAGGNIALQGVFQALDCGISSLIISLLRLLVIVLPLAKIFSVMNNAAEMIWFAFPIAELIALIVAVYLLIKANHHTVDNMGEREHF
ncbi:MAG: MATE family efflux transporter [Clostridia bacterium]|nr:MATE family efflux transporter [Clostridia bacterium]NCC44351.1 MATE family efflux transporter [Clostridia bacterium]